jgi:hypothetical protein
MPNDQEQERRKGTKDRRDAKADRRNEDRTTDDLLPRRNLDEPNRRNDKA